MSNPRTAAFRQIDAAKNNAKKRLAEARKESYKRKSKEAHRETYADPDYREAILERNRIKYRGAK